jgi:ketosteroid isomerase-like protein
MDNLSITLDYMRKVAVGELDGALALCSDEFVFRGPDGTAHNKDSMRAALVKIRPQLINPFEFEVLGTTCEGDRVAVESVGSTVLANGRTYSNIYHFLFEVKNHQIVAAREYCDTTRAAAFG